MIGYRTYLIHTYGTASGRASVSGIFEQCEPVTSMIIGITFTGHTHVLGETRIRQRNKEEVSMGRKI